MVLGVTPPIICSHGLAVEMSTSAGISSTSPTRTSITIAAPRASWPQDSDLVSFGAPTRSESRRHGPLVATRFQSCGLAQQIAFRANQDHYSDVLGCQT